MPIRIETAETLVALKPLERRAERYRIYWTPHRQVRTPTPAPLPGSISLPRLFVLHSSGWGQGRGAHNPIHRGDINKTLKAFPQHRDALDAPVPARPCIRVQQHRPWRVRHRAGQHRRVHHPPGDHPRPRQAPDQPVGGRPLAIRDPAATGQNRMPDRDSPAARVPFQAGERRVGAADRHAGPQQPCDRVAPRGRVAFDRHTAQTLIGATCSAARRVGGAASPAASAPARWRCGPAARPARAEARS